ncbi:MAG TPA: hypothetical protein VMJ75_27095 [Candidatus Acidoferrales bacterium]|nr:hypothetical protein [Candidatus Acidoferrales bacterium]
MFFRRERPRTPTFQERLDTLKSGGFGVASLPDGSVRVTKGICAVDIRESGGEIAWKSRAGILIGGEIAPLVDGGYQKFFRTSGGVRKPALAEELAALHNFEEDLRQALGQQVLYNEALGTVSTFYQYDRVQDRDRGVPKRAWE